jgi:hypothetical protein
MSLVRSSTTRLHARRGGAAAVVLAAITGLAPVTAARAALGFQLTPASGIFCDTLTVDVTVDASVSDLRGFTFVFEFDPTKIVPISVQRGPLVTGASCGSFFQWLNSAAIGDSIYADGALLGCSVNGPGSILRMKFVGVTQGTSFLRCRSSTLRDSLNQNMPHTCPQVNVRYSCTPIAVERNRWTSLKRIYQ